MCVVSSHGVGLEARVTLQPISRSLGVCWCGLWVAWLRICLVMAQQTRLYVVVHSDSGFELAGPF